MTNELHIGNHGRGSALCLIHFWEIIDVWFGKLCCAWRCVGGWAATLVSGADLDQSAVTMAEVKVLCSYETVCTFIALDTWMLWAISSALLYCCIVSNVSNMGWEKEEGWGEKMTKERGRREEGWKRKWGGGEEGVGKEEEKEGGKEEEVYHLYS